MSSPPTFPSFQTHRATSDHVPITNQTQLLQCLRPFRSGPHLMVQVSLRGLQDPCTPKYREGRPPASSALPIARKLPTQDSSQIPTRTCAQSSRRHPSPEVPNPRPRSPWPGEGGRPPRAPSAGPTSSADARPREVRTQVCGPAGTAALPPRDDPRRARVRGPGLRRRASQVAKDPE